jgi:hypothetical protein
VNGVGVGGMEAVAEKRHGSYLPQGGTGLSKVGGGGGGQGYCVHRCACVCEVRLSVCVCRGGAGGGGSGKLGP